MKRICVVLLVPLLLLAAVACDDDDEGATPEPTEPPAGTPAPEPTPDPNGDPNGNGDDDGDGIGNGVGNGTGNGNGDQASCLEAPEYVADGPITVEQLGDGDAGELVDLRWAPHEGCERVVIDLVTEDGEPATSPGTVEAEVLRDQGVVRVHLPDVEWADPDALDAAFDGPLATAAYVVRSPDDGERNFVDIHLGDEAEAAVTVLEDRVVIDLVPGGGEVPQPTVSDDVVVVLEPRPGEASEPLAVAGYSRTFEANVVVRIMQDGEEVYEDFTTTTGWADAWGYYEFTIDEGLSGPIELQVGDYSAKDGTWEGITVDLELP